MAEVGVRVEHLEQWRTETVDPWKKEAEPRIRKLEQWKVAVMAAIAVLSALGIGGGFVVKGVSAAASAARVEAIAAARQAQDAGKQISQTVAQEAARAVKVALAKNVVPVGTIVAFAGPIQKNPQGWVGLPGGWLLCDGSALDAGKDEQYDSLYQAISVSWGIGGGGPKQFNLPDLRGLFLRGTNSGRSGPFSDPDATTTRVALYPGGATGDRVGSYQDAGIGQHNHKLQVQNSGSIANVGHFGQPVMMGEKQGASGSVGKDKDDILLDMKNPGETRPKNAAVNWIIKAE